MARLSEAGNGPKRTGNGIKWVGEGTKWPSIRNKTGTKRCTAPPFRPSQRTMMGRAGGRAAQERYTASLCARRQACGLAFLGWFWGCFFFFFGAGLGRIRYGEKFPPKFLTCMRGVLKRVILSILPLSLDIGGPLYVARIT